MAQCIFQPRVRRRHWRTPAVLLCLLLIPLARGASGVDVEIHGVDDEIRDNVLAYLSFERYKKGGVELTADTVDRLHNRVEREVDAALRPFGYYEPQVQSSVDRAGQRRVAGGRGHHSRRAGAGRYKSTCASTVPGEADPLFQRILRHLPLHSGDRLQHKAYEDIKNDLQRTAATYGYLDARLIRSDLVVDPPNHKANIALELDTGERYHFGKTSIKQQVVRESLVRRYLRYHEGDPFDLTQVLRSQFALDDAQYFTNLEVLPGEPDRDAPYRAGQHPCRRQPPAPLLARRRLCHRHRSARHARVRGPPHQLARPQFQRRGAGRAGDQVQPADPLHHPDRGPGGGELQPARLGRTARLG